MMRGGFAAAISRGSSTAPVAAAASATFMRFFKPCSVSNNQQNLEAAGTPGDKERQTCREGFVKTPSLQKEMKTKDIFNAARKETEAPSSGDEEKGKGEPAAAYGGGQK